MDNCTKLFPLWLGLLNLSKPTNVPFSSVLKGEYRPTGYYDKPKIDDDAAVPESSMLLFIANAPKGF